MARRALRIVLLTLGYAIAVPIVLVVLVFVALAIPPIRAFAVQKGVDYANQTLDGYKVAVKSVDRLDPWGIKARGIQLFDDKKREMVNVPWLLVHINPLALIKNTLELRRVEIDGVRAHLYPSEPKPEEPEEPPSEPSTFTIRVNHARIRSATLAMDWSGRALHAVVGTLAAAGQYGPKPALAIEQANLRVTVDRDELLRLRTTEGDFKAETGGRVGIAALLAGGAPLTLEADIPPLSEVDPWPVDAAQLRISNVTRRTLALLGVEDGGELNAPVDLALDAAQDAGRIDAKLTLQSNKSRLVIDAGAEPKRYELAVYLTPTKLSALSGLLPDIELKSTLRAVATPGYDLNRDSLVPHKAELAWSNVAVDDGKVPSGKINVELPLPIVRLVGLTLAGMENALAVAGEYDTEKSRGKAELDFREFELNRIDALATRGIAGLIDGGLSAKFSAAELAAQGDVRLLEFAHPSAAVDKLALKFTASGPPTAPHGDLKLDLDGIKAKDFVLDEVRSEAQVTTKTIAARLQIHGPDSLMNAEIGGQRLANGQLRMQGIGRGTIVKKDFRFDLRELLYGDSGVTVQELSLYSGDQGLRITGSLDAKQELAARMNLSKFDLAEWTALAGVEGVSGQLDGVVEVAGTSEAPRIDTLLELTHAAYRSELPIDAKLNAKGDLAARRASVTLDLASSKKLGAAAKAKKEMKTLEPLKAKVRFEASLPKRPQNLAKAAERAKIAADIDAHLPVRQLSTLGGDALAGLEGMLDLKLKADGTLDDPTVDTELRARLKLPEEKGDPFEALRLTASIRKEDAKVDLWTQDEDGQLLTFNGALDWPGGSPRAALENTAGFKSANFTLQAELKERRLDIIQGVFAYFSKLYALALPLRAGGKVHVEGKDGTLSGGAQLKAIVFGDKLDGRCALGTQSAFDFDAKLREDRVDVDVNINTDGGGSVRGNLTSALDLKIQTGGEPEIGPAKVTLDGKDIAIHKLPGLCTLTDGRATFSVAASGLGKQKPELDLKGHIENLRAPNGVAMNVDTMVRAGGASAEARVDLKDAKRTVGLITARVPLSYPDGTTPTVLPNAPLDARIKLADLTLANVLAFTEAVGNVKGTASADITVKGKVSDPYPEGHVELENVNMTIASLAQPLRRVNGRIEVRGRSVKIPKLTARDRDGKLSIEGFGSFNQDFAGEAGLYVEADEFPLRQQGTIVGELTTRARMDMKIPSDLKATAELKIIDGRIWLTGERGKKVQSLDAHPDVRFSDEKVEIESTPAEDEAAGKEGFTFASFKIRTERELWLLHNDFSIQVGVDMNLADGEQGPELTGSANITRGELKLLGKIFTLDKNSAIRFNGPMPPDPVLDIRATFEPPTGQPLVVQVSGSGSAPVLEFSGAATNIGEAVAVLTGRDPATSGAQSQGSEDPTSQMAKVASSMTAGLLIMTARREFGDWVPMITVETGESGQPTAARAGFDASKLIPSWLDGFAKGAYVEGIFSGGNQRGASGGGSRAGVGVRLEVALPRDFVTSVGLGPVQGAWSTDVAWSP